MSERPARAHASGCAEGAPSDEQTQPLTPGAQQLIRTLTRLIRTCAASGATPPRIDPATQLHPSP